ncbi:hypothetical protein ASD36_03995 [Rhizobium sp. Root1334]|nr:hypothetical protein ASC96_00405 [Rhizobium sp. Root1204]KQY17794.1 hypothetical protein ASD36_03995 [Rhizobium sp. Root1334]
MHPQMWPSPADTHFYIEKSLTAAKLALYFTENGTVDGQSIDDFKCGLRIHALNDRNVMEQSAFARLNRQCMFDMLITA